MNRSLHTWEFRDPKRLVGRPERSSPGRLHFDGSPLDVPTAAETADEADRTRWYAARAASRARHPSSAC